MLTSICQPSLTPFSEATKLGMSTFQSPSLFANKWIVQVDVESLTTQAHSYISIQGLIRFSKRIGICTNSNLPYTQVWVWYDCLVSEVNVQTILTGQQRKMVLDYSLVNIMFSSQDVKLMNTLCSLTMVSEHAIFLHLTYHTTLVLFGHDYVRYFSCS